jgi:hypothetical protein
VYIFCNFSGGDGSSDKARDGTAGENGDKTGQSSHDGSESAQTTPEKDHPGDYYPNYLYAIFFIT